MLGLAARTHGATMPAEGSVAYFEGDYVSLADAKISVLTHSFMYGTAAP